MSGEKDCPLKIGIVLPLSTHRANLPAYSYREIRALAQGAEQAALDSVWLYDQLMYRNDDETIGIWECWTMLAALAEATERVELGTLVTSTMLRNPALLAKMAVGVEEISGGRLNLGLGAGWNVPELEAFGYPTDHPVDRFEEAVQIIVPLLRGESVTFDGRYYRAEECILLPPGPRSQGPTLVCGGHGPRMMRLAARYFDAWNTDYVIGAEDPVERRTALEAACHEVGRDPSTLAVTALSAVAFPDLAAPPAFMQGRLIDSADGFARALSGFEGAGVSHVMLHVEPATDRALTRIRDGIAIYRSHLSPQS